jgi:hypothetical protein
MRRGIAKENANAGRNGQSDERLARQCLQLFHCSGGCGY